MEAVRPATAGDLARCDELAAIARVEGAGRRGGDLLVDLGTWLGAPPGTPGGGAALGAWVAGAPDRTVLVGLFEGAVVGAAAGEVLRTAGSADRRLGRVVWCYVEPDARQVGTGSALVEHLLEWFAAQGCTDVDAPALPGDRATKQLYEHAGFKARLLVLHRAMG